jgi:hypothetical protein
VEARPVAAIRGLVAAATGDADGAVGWFEDAVADVDGRRLRIESADVRRLFALALDRLGLDPARAADLREDAAVRYLELGMDRHAGLVRAPRA